MIRETAKKVLGLLLTQQKHQLKIVTDHNLGLPTVVQTETDLVIEETDNIVFVARRISPTDIPEYFELLPIRQLLSNLDKVQFERISKAAQLLEWQHNHHFCSRCGHATHQHPHDRFATHCPACEYTQYPRIQSCVIVAITRGKELLLARSHRHTSMFSLIAGFVETGETLEQAVAREVKEEVGLEISNIRYMNSQPWPFPSNLMIGFRAEYAGGDLTLEEAEIAEADFFTVDNLPPLPPKGTIAEMIISQILSENSQYST